MIVLPITLLGAACASGQPATAAQPLPDYPAAYRQLSADLQPAGENGWDLLMGLADLHRKIAARHADEAYMSYNEGYVDYTLLWDPDRLDDEYTIDTQFARIEAQIADARDSGVLDMLAELATMDNLVQPVNGAPMLSRVFPQMGVSRALARLNAARITMAASSGDDTEELVAAFGQSIWLSRHVSASAPVMIGELLGLAIEFLTLERVRDAITQQQVPASMAERLLAELDAQIPMPPIKAALDAEQMMRLDTIARLYTDDGRGDGLFVAERLDLLHGDDADGDIAFAAPATGKGSSTYATKKQIIAREAEIHAALLAMLAAPPQQREALDDAISLDLEQQEPLIPTGTANLLLKLLLPSVERMSHTADQYALDLAATRIMLAIEVYRAQHHQVPPALEVLVPNILRNVPLDPFTRAPLLYRPAPDTALGYVLYSAGFDREDNEGFVSPDLRHPAVSLRSRGVGSDYPFVPME
ncbi:MAG: hypothetical protein Q9O74_12605 [Planctomycetota bacterium]|nr:hypothetical protein [Planctomycetota bacterium]